MTVHAPILYPSEITGLRALTHRLILPIYIATIFLSSALLFLIEPMFAKMVLPLLGGTPAVWNTCMVFFQACLLAGYAYGHFSIRWLGIRRQAILQISLLLIALMVLPVAIPHGWRPPVAVNPLGWLLALLLVAVGLPFFAVSTTGPVIQRWFSSTGHRAGADPYFLYAASNLGSMLALLGYPAIVEPLLRLAMQAHLWMVGYSILVLLTAICAIFSGGESRRETVEVKSTISISRRLRWILLALIPSSQLLGVTTFIATDIAAVPLFWVLPLAIYLLSFILVFSSKCIVSHAAMIRMLPIVMLGLALFMLSHAAQPVWMILGLHLAALFVTSMVCHGELAKDRPAADRLTDFYLTMSVGGVLGGLFNALLAPLIFNTAAEYPIALVAACLLCPARSRVGTAHRISSALPMVGSAHPTTQEDGVSAWDVAIPLLIGLLAWGLSRTLSNHPQLSVLALGIPVILVIHTIRHRWRFAGSMAALMIVAGAGISHGQLLQIHRSFFGIHRIVRSDQGPFNDLYHGTTVHGRQRIESGRPVSDREAMTYYHRTGPIGQIFSNPEVATPGKNIAVVGLGVGSLAAYAGPGQHLTYYEIDPVVKWAADDSGYFTFLSSARARGADVNIVLGDARLTLQQAADHSCDVLVLDAFSGDAVPVHLLTREAMKIYLSKITDGGFLAIHISNMYLDLLPVTSALAADSNCTGWYCNDLDLSPKQAADGKMASQWVVITRSPKSVSWLTSEGHWRPLSGISPAKVWTDDYSNILGIFRFTGK